MMRSELACATTAAHPNIPRRQKIWKNWSTGRQLIANSVHILDGGRCNHDKPKQLSLNIHRENPSICLQNRERWTKHHVSRKKYDCKQSGSRRGVLRIANSSECVSRRLEDYNVLHTLRGKVYRVDHCKSPQHHVTNVGEHLAEEQLQTVFGKCLAK